MYSKGSLAATLDAGEAFLHMRRAQWGCTTGVFCTLHARGGNLPRPQRGQHQTIYQFLGLDFDELFCFFGGHFGYLKSGKHFVYLSCSRLLLCQNSARQFVYLSFGKEFLNTPRSDVVRLAPSGLHLSCPFCGFVGSLYRGRACVQAGSNGCQISVLGSIFYFTRRFSGNWFRKTYAKWRKQKRHLSIFRQTKLLGTCDYLDHNELTKD